MEPSEQTNSIDPLEKIISLSRQYYEQETLDLNRNYYHQFIQNLPVNLRGYFLQIGFEKGCHSTLFKRFVFENTGISLQTYLASRLSSQEMVIWHEQERYYKNLLESLT